MRAKNILFLGILALSAAAHAEDSTAYRLFERAIKNDSTSPNFVLVKVVDDKARKTEVICTEAPFLLGAIHREHGLPNDASGTQKATALALAQKDLTFHFSQREALDNLTRAFTASELREVRDALQSRSDDELLKGFRGDGTELDALYMGKGVKKYSAYRDAIAQVLLERGLLPRRGCVAGFLTVEK